MGYLRGVAGMSPLGGGPGAVARVRAFLPLLNPIPKSQKGHRDTRVPPRHEVIAETSNQQEKQRPGSGEVGWGCASGTGHGAEWGMGCSQQPAGGPYGAGVPHVPLNATSLILSTLINLLCDLGGLVGVRAYL